MEESGLSEAELFCWLAINRLDVLKPNSLLTLLELFGDFETVLARGYSEGLRAAGLSADAIPRIVNMKRDKELCRNVEMDLEWLRAEHHHVVCFSHDLYPPLLKQIDAPPPVLFIDGDPEVLNRFQIAVVGSRKPTSIGKKTASDFARNLSDVGLVVTSGMALGIDAASHYGALKGASPTIAVFGTGLDEIYPRRHQRLAEKIRERGALVSEFPNGTKALPQHFPRRNRIITGMALGTLIVEATLKSGSLISARLASEQNREVFAIPGSIYNPAAKGCHQLIRDGAKLVETVADILEEITSIAGFQLEQVKSEKQNAVFSSIERKIVTQLSVSPTGIDQVVENTGLPVNQVASALVQLEIRGIVKWEAQGYTLIPAVLRNR